MMEIIFSPVTHLIAIILLLSIVVASTSIAPWVPTSKKDLKRINALAGLKEGSMFYEIGCGNGRVCSYIAKNNPSAKVIGCELAFPFYVFCELRQMLFGPKNLEIRFKNALREDFGNADVVYVFGIERAMKGPLKDKVKRELKPGARFMSYVFPLTAWGDAVEEDRSDGSPKAVYTYTQK